MFKKRTRISRLFTFCLSVLLMTTAIYAAESGSEDLVEQQVQEESVEPAEAFVEAEVPTAAEEPAPTVFLNAGEEVSEEVTALNEVAPEVSDDSIISEEPEVPAETDASIDNEVPEETQAPTEAEISTEGEVPTESEVPEDSQLPVESEDTKESEVPTESESSPVNEEAVESESTLETEIPETEVADITVQLESESSQEQDNGIESNADLVASEQIVIPPSIEDSFRFITIDKVYALVLEDNVNVYDSHIGSEEPEVIGTLQKDSLCFIIEEVNGGNWIYIESGVVRGFVKSEYILTGELVNTLVEEEGEENFALAESLIEPINNRALVYTKTTTQQTVIDKIYAIANIEILNIYEEKDTMSLVVGELADESLCYIIADGEEDWIYIESNDVRGFVEKEFLTTGDETTEMVLETGEDNFEQAEEIIPIEENKACYYTLTSIKEGIAGNAIRSSMVKFAQQFLGNPYVWGGTSLTNGADCSGFVQSIYRHYGYSLPRVAENQAQYGMKIPVESAEPGDLIFYAENGYIYHVVLYIGDGKVIHASSPTTGIIISNVYKAEAVWATRIINDSDTPNIQ